MNNGNMVFDAGLCPVAMTLRLISGKWKPIILFLIEHKCNRFGMLMKNMPAISKKVLTHQLRDLEKHKLITREVIVMKHPQEVVYKLTHSGSSLRKLIDNIFDWGTESILNEPGRNEMHEFNRKAKQHLYKL